MRVLTTSSLWTLLAWGLLGSWVMAGEDARSRVGPLGFVPVSVTLRLGALSQIVPGQSAAKGRGFGAEVQRGSRLQHGTLAFVPMSVTLKMGGLPSSPMQPSKRQKRRHKNRQKQQRLASRSGTNLLARQQQQQRQRQEPPKTNAASTISSPAASAFSTNATAVSSFPTRVKSGSVKSSFGDVDGSSVHRKPRRPAASSTPASSTSLEQVSAAGNVPPKRRRRPRRSGAFPNAEWRAVPMHALRDHPLYTALPPPHSLPRVLSEADFSQVRQGSKAWDVMHRGRITTSQCATALGFYEPQAAEYLGVPMGLRGHERVVRTYSRILAGPPQEGYLAAVQNILERESAHGRFFTQNSTAAGGAAGAEDLAWCQHMNPYMKNRGWVCELYARGNKLRPRPKRFIMGGTGPVRMAWGSAQEATALLCVLNFFSGKFDAESLILQECGMFCGDEIKGGSSLVSLGASPDGILVDSKSGAIHAVVEVKCHSPFRMSRRGEFEIACGGPLEGLPSWHIPQLFLEMACSGAKQGFLCSLSALKGAKIFRIRWDLEYYTELTRFLSRFVCDYVDKKAHPKRNFFWGEEGYERFLQRTMEIARSAEMVACVAPQDVQRWDPHRESPFHDGS